MLLLFCLQFLSKLNDQEDKLSCNCHVTNFLILVLYIKMQLSRIGEKLKSRGGKAEIQSQKIWIHTLGPGDLLTA